MLKILSLSLFVLLGQLVEAQLSFQYSLRAKNTEPIFFLQSYENEDGEMVFIGDNINHKDSMITIQTYDGQIGSEFDLMFDEKTRGYTPLEIMGTSKGENIVSINFDRIEPIDGEFNFSKILKINQVFDFTVECEVPFTVSEIFETSDQSLFMVEGKEFAPIPKEFVHAGLLNSDFSSKWIYKYSSLDLKNITIWDVIQTKNNEIAMVGSSSSGGFLLVIDSFGEVLASRIYKDYSITSIDTSSTGDGFICYGRNGNFANGIKNIITNVTKNGEVQQAVQFEVLNAQFSGKLKYDKKGVLTAILGNSFGQSGKFVIAKLERDFTTKWIKQYSNNLSPVIEKHQFHDDGSIQILTSPHLLEFAVTKIDSLGNLGSCPSQEVCITKKNATEPETQPLSWQRTPINLLQSSEVIKVNKSDTLFLEPYCGMVDSFQIPNFEIIDSICQNSSIKPTNLTPDSVDYWQWEFEEGSPSISNEANPDSIFFFKEGRFLVTQKIWQNGCLDSIRKTIEVLPIPTISLAPDTTICNGKNFTIFSNSFNTDSFIWSNGDITSSISIAESGIYSLIAKNFFCSVSDNITVDFFEEYLEMVDFDENQTKYLDCDFDEISIEIPEFEFLKTSWSDNYTVKERIVDNPDVYKWRISLDECEKENAINVLSEKCGIDYYIPTAFSPNNDGVNDFFTIYTSNGIVVKSLSIFDRWGNFIFHDERIQSSQNIWDGTYKGQPVAPGVYSWFVTLESLNGDSFIEKGDITVIK